MSFSRVVIEKMAYALPPQVVTSEQLEQNLEPLYERLNLQVGRLELMTGIKERRFWESNHKASQASAEAGVKLLEEGNIDPRDVDLLIHSAVCRDRLEPATASYVHKLMGLSQYPDPRYFKCLPWIPQCTDTCRKHDRARYHKSSHHSGRRNGKPLDETIKLLNEANLDRKSIKPFLPTLQLAQVLLLGQSEMKTK